MTAVQCARRNRPHDPFGDQVPHRGRCDAAKDHRAEDVRRGRKRFGRPQQREDHRTETPGQRGNANRLSRRAERHPSFRVGRLPVLPKPGGAHRVATSTNADQHRHHDESRKSPAPLHPAAGAGSLRPGSTESARRRTAERTTRAPPETLTSTAPQIQRLNVTRAQGVDRRLRRHRAIRRVHSGRRRTCSGYGHVSSVVDGCATA